VEIAMDRKIRIALPGLACFALPVTALAQQSTKPDAPPDWRELNAYALGVQSYLYAFPWVYLPQAIWDRTEARGTPPNQFVHFRGRPGAW